ncbi:MAG: FAD-dependent thymidylate synthase [Candidatus Methanospirareceae archaeon]
MEVRLINVTRDGVDLVAGAARISGPMGEEDARRIVEMLTENDYSSALEHIYFTFDISGISVALSRELLEHRIASHTARSTRYNEEAGFSYYMPKELEERGEEVARIYKEVMQHINKAYMELRKKGVTRESARYVLPLALHTHYVVTMNARSLINFFMLRLCVRAAPEMRELAMRMYKICLREYPEIFSHVWCRGFTLGVCPENDVRDNFECPFKKILPKKREIKGGFEGEAKKIIEASLSGLIDKTQG